MEKLNFLFWNTGRTATAKTIADLALENETDVLILAENTVPRSAILSHLNEQVADYQLVGNIFCQKIQIYSKFNSSYFETIEDAARWTIRKLTIPSFCQLLIAAVHFPSRLNWSRESLEEEARGLHAVIREREAELDLKNTIVVGDFNLNPFEQGMISAIGLHGVMDRNIARASQRRVGRRDFEFFYNPMWSFLGDLSKGNVPGTMHYRSSQLINFDWNTFDMVLIRPGLIDNFDTDYLDILTQFGETSFLTANGLPDKKFSDHLPIRFSIRLT